MALPNVGLTCYASVALQLMADATRNAPAATPNSMLETALVYLRSSRNIDMPLQMPRQLMLALCAELGLQVGIPDDPSSVLMQLCSDESLAAAMGNSAVSRVCTQCNTQAHVGLPGMPFSLVAVPTDTHCANLSSLFEPTDEAEKKCTKCGGTSWTLKRGDTQTLVYLARDITRAPVQVDFPLVLCEGQELMGIGLWKSFHYTYMSRHTDGIWRYYNDESVVAMPAGWVPDGEVLSMFSTMAVALLYGPPSSVQHHCSLSLSPPPLTYPDIRLHCDNQEHVQDELVNNIYELSPLKPKLFSRMRSVYLNGPWIQVCLNDSVVGRLLYVPDCSRPHITQDNWVVFHDIRGSGHVFLLPASHIFLTNKPLRAGPLKRQNQPRIYVSVHHH